MNIIQDMSEELSEPSKIGWFYLVVFVFLIFFLGNHLLEAVQTFQIPNIRTTDKVLYSQSPLWFTFVAVFKLLFWLFSILVTYKFIRKVANKYA